VANEARIILRVLASMVYQISLFLREYASMARKGLT